MGVYKGGNVYKDYLKGAFRGSITVPSLVSTLGFVSFWNVFRVFHSLPTGVRIDRSYCSIV